MIDDRFVLMEHILNVSFIEYTHRESVVFHDSVT